MALLPSHTFSCMLEMLEESKNLEKTQQGHLEKAKAHMDKATAAQGELSDLLGNMVNKGVFVEVSGCSWFP